MALVLGGGKKAEAEGEGKAKRKEIIGEDGGYGAEAGAGGSPVCTVSQRRICGTEDGKFSSAGSWPMGMWPLLPFSRSLHLGVKDAFCGFMAKASIWKSSTTN
jgi:hypothetical protein